MSKIEWTDVTWNPVIGCAKVSAGCKNCYAETMAARVALMQKAQGKESPYLRVVDVERRRWNGRAVFLPERLGEPLRWRKPCRVFVNSMSDLFHEDITFEQIAAVVGVMAATPHITYQVLTKRPARMLKWFASVRGSCPDSDVLHSASMLMLDASPLYRALERSSLTSYASRWPLPNVHLGVSVEDQASADERIPLLLQCPAALRFLSVEPLLGPVTLLRWTCGEHGRRHIGAPPGIGWVIVGGESGPGARPCDVSWIRSVVEQCRSAGVPVFVKQLGQNCITQHPVLPPGNAIRVPFVDRKGGNPEEWPEDLRVQEFPEVPRG